MESEEVGGRRASASLAAKSEPSATREWPTIIGDDLRGYFIRRLTVVAAAHAKLRMHAEPNAPIKIDRREIASSSCARTYRKNATIVARRNCAAYWSAKYMQHASQSPPQRSGGSWSGFFRGL